MDWRMCTETGQAKPVTPDIELAQSLEKTSANKRFSSEHLPLLPETAGAKISLGYDAVRELLKLLQRTSKALLKSSRSLRST